MIAVANHPVSSFGLINSSVRRLSHIRRYSSLPVIRPENVAEHSFYNAMLSYVIAVDMRTRGYDVDPDVALRKATFHDFDEIATGDILRSFKYSTPALLEAIERSGEMRMEEIVEHFGVASSDIHGTWAEAKQGREGDIVAFCDLMCVVAYVREEHLTGNRHLDNVAREVHGYISERYPRDGAFGPYVEDLYPNNDPLDIFREAA